MCYRRDRNIRCIYANRVRELSDIYQYQPALLFLTWSTRTVLHDSIYAQTAWSRVIMYATITWKFTCFHMGWRIGIRETCFPRKKHAPSGETSFPNVQKHETVNTMHPHTEKLTCFETWCFETCFETSFLVCAQLNILGKIQEFLRGGGLELDWHCDRPARHQRSAAPRGGWGGGMLPENILN